MARQRPVRLFLPGPAAGVIGARLVGRAAELDDLITVDMGGTSCDIALVRRGKPLLRPEGRIDGYPVRVPMVDVNAVGAGGGSIAWLDGAGGLRVGPHSAGADPGPACYGQGGTRPTVTDASLVLGWLNPAFFAGGTLALHLDKARAALEEQIARPLGLSPEQAALGIHRVVNTQMAEGIRLVSVRQGFDPRRFTLLALGGAGPLHATALAEELHVGQVLVPRHPGVLAAAGLLAAAVEHEVSAAFGRTLEGLALADVRAALAILDERCAQLMAAERRAAEEVLHFADLCYVGQSYHLEIALPPDAAEPLARLYQDFLVAHDRVYGHSVPAPARIVNLRAVHRCGGRDRLPDAHWQGADAASTDAATRLIRLGAGPVTASVHRREALRPGTAYPGPAVVEQADTTTLITPGWVAAVVADGHLALTRTDADERQRP